MRVSAPNAPDGLSNRFFEGNRALGVLVRVRFAHGALQLLALGPSLHFGWTAVGDLPYSLGALAALLAFNLVSLAALRRGQGSGPASLLVQTLADLVAMVVLFGVAGGLTNPLHSLIHFQIGLAALLLPPRLALITLAAGWAALAALASSQAGLANFTAWIGPLGPNLAFEWLLAAVVAGFALFAAGVNRRGAERLREARERMHQLDRLRAVGATAAGFCHELATPLNASTLLGGRLRRKTSERAVAPATSEAGAPDTLEADWEELERNLARCERIVRGMAAAPWEADTLAVQRADVGLLARKLAAERAGGNPLKLTIPEGDLHVQAPSVSLGQVLLNLLRNAEEASPPGAAIEVSLHEEPAAVRVRVADRGAGMRADVLGALGTPFNSSKGEGRGLGLFSALHLVESLGGTLSFHARAGGGTEAWLTLPRPAHAGDAA